MTFANANPAADAIHFNIPGAGVRTISPLEALPNLTDNAGTTIDGYTQPGASPNTQLRGNDASLRIEVDASAVPSGTSGFFMLFSDNNTVRGLVISRYLIDSGVAILGSHNTIEGNFIGTDPTGMMAAPSRAGVTVFEGAGNRIGGPAPASRNVIVGDNLNVVTITAGGSTVQGNYIGTNREGTASLGGLFNGIAIDSAPGNLIGGYGVGEGNLVSGNGTAIGCGIVVFSSGNTIAGNLVGTDRDGLVAIPNGGCGISIGQGANNLVSANTIAFNGGVGVETVPGARLTANSIFSNGGLGIFTGSLDGIPTLASASSNGVRTRIEGALSGLPNAAVRLEFFASPECDPSGFGEGRTFLGAVTVTTDGAGNVPIQATVAASGPGVLTATATDPAGNTSQFSECVPIEFTVRAQNPAFSPEFQVNTYTTNSQSESAVGVDPFGNFVVAWQSLSQLGAGVDVFGQRYDSLGAPVGGEFQVNTTTAGAQAHPSVGMDFFGTFFVVWGGDDISGRRFDAGGTPQGDDFPISTNTSGPDAYPEIARNAAGDFVVVWEGFSGNSLTGVLGRRFDTNGAPQGDAFPVNTEPAAIDTPGVATDEDGDFVAVWTSLDEDGSLHGLAGQRFDSTGAPQGGEFQVNSYTTGTQTYGSVGMDGAGNFTVSWASEGDGSETGVFARRYDAGGQALDGEFLINGTTAESQLRPRLAMDSSGDFVVAWTSQGQDGQGYGVFARQFDSSGRPVGPEFQVNTYTFGGQARPDVAISDFGSFVVSWTDYIQDGSGTAIFARRADARAPQPMRVDAYGAGATSNRNGVLESGETVAVVPAWRNAHFAPLSLEGAASSLVGPPGPVYTIDDAEADYGTIAPGLTEDCFGATLDCYVMTVSGARPATHWDAAFDETVTIGATKEWTLHVGGSFADTLPSHPFYAYVENVFHNGVTGGCGAGNYCPGNPVRRDQIAVFLLKGARGPAYTPPACTGVFSDVPCPSQFADWVEQLAAEGITAGCGTGVYCPEASVTRQQMATFLLKAEHGAGYTPPACAGLFEDVPCPSQFAAWIERLANEAITGGCSTSPALFCPGSPTNRGQMAVFLVRTFGLLLYGP